MARILVTGSTDGIGLETARAWEEQNRQWGYVGLLASLGFVLYAGLKWRRVALS